jgi:hypothetical protein
VAGVFRRGARDAAESPVESFDGSRYTPAAESVTVTVCTWPLSNATVIKRPRT